MKYVWLYVAVDLTFGVTVKDQSPVSTHCKRYERDCDGFKNCCRQECENVGQYVNHCREQGQGHAGLDVLGLCKCYSAGRVLDFSVHCWRENSNFCNNFKVCCTDMCKDAQQVTCKPADYATTGSYIGEAMCMCNGATTVTTWAAATLALLVVVQL